VSQGLRYPIRAIKDEPPETSWESLRIIIWIQLKELRDFQVGCQLENQEDIGSPSTLLTKKVDSCQECGAGTSFSQLRKHYHGKRRTGKKKQRWPFS